MAEQRTSKHRSSSSSAAAAAEEGGICGSSSCAPPRCAQACVSVPRFTPMANRALDLGGAKEICVRAQQSAEHSMRVEALPLLVHAL